LVEIIFNKFI